jgi:hypothetical protein
LPPGEQAAPEGFSHETSIGAHRTFREDDTADHPPVGIIDERLARQIFGNESPLGKRFRISIAPGMPWLEVVGVAGHVRHEALDRDPRPQVYWPYAQRTEDRLATVIRTAGDPASMPLPFAPPSATSTTTSPCTT